MVIYNSFEDWLKGHDNKVIRYLTYKRMFTPYEEDQKFLDESQFEDSTYTLAVIESATRLGYDEWLLGFREYFDLGDYSNVIEYRKLSEIQLAEVETDTDEYIHVG